MLENNCLFTNILDVKRKTATRQVGASKYNRKSIKYGTTTWALKQKRKWNLKINDQKNKSLYYWIMHHPKVVQSQIVNDYLKVEIDDHPGQQLVPKLLFHVSVRELHNNIFSDAENGGLKEARDKYDNIIISDSTLCSLLPPQLKKCCQDTRSCVVVNVAYLPKLYIHNYCNCDIFI